MKSKWIDRLGPYQGGGSMIKNVETDSSTYLEGFQKFEAGTPPIAEVIGLSASVDFINEVGIDKIYEYENQLTQYAYDEMKKNGEKISMLTAYDYTLARIIDNGGIDVILVGDSASNVMAGHQTTIPVTLEQMIYHASSVVKGTNRALVVVDMPFGSYQGNSKKALSSAIRIMKESGGHSVKLEGGSEIIDSIERILTAGIPVSYTHLRAHET